MTKQEQTKNIWKVLSRYGIKTEADLDRELKNMTPLNIGIMTSTKKKVA